MSDVETPAPTMADAAEMLWVVLANVSGGDWSKQSQDWQDAAERWRDYYFRALNAERSRPLADPVDLSEASGNDHRGVAPE